MAKVVASTPIETTDSYVFMIHESGAPYKASKIRVTVEDKDKVLSVAGEDVNNNVLNVVKFDLPQSANADAIAAASVNGSLIISAKKLNRPKIVAKVVTVTRLPIVQI